MMPFGNLSTAAAHSSTPDWPEMGHARDLDRLEEGLALGGAGDQAGHRDRVAADIEDAAAGQIVGEQAVFGLECAACRSRSST